jgi:hypothetical protein
MPDAGIKENVMREEEKEEEEDKCPVCLEALTDANVRQLSCGHPLCKGCDVLLRTKPQFLDADDEGLGCRVLKNCPICRRKETVSPEMMKARIRELNAQKQNSDIKCLELKRVVENVNRDLNRILAHREAPVLPPREAPVLPPRAAPVLPPRAAAPPVQHRFHRELVIIGRSRAIVQQTGQLGICCIPNCNVNRNRRSRLVCVGGCGLNCCAKHRVCMECNL